MFLEILKSVVRNPKRQKEKKIWFTVPFEFNEEEIRAD